MTKIGEGFLNKPEDLCFDEEGTLYTATRDGWIKRMHRNGSWEDWKLIGGDSLLGVATTRSGGIIVCDALKVRFIDMSMSKIIASLFHWQILS